MKQRVFPKVLSQTAATTTQAQKTIAAVLSLSVAFAAVVAVAAGDTEETASGELGTALRNKEQKERELKSENLSDKKKKIS